MVISITKEVFLIGGKFFLNTYILLTYNVSGVQQGDLDIHILSLIIFHYRYYKISTIQELEANCFTILCWFLLYHSTQS